MGQHAGRRRVGGPIHLRESADPWAVTTPGLIVSSIRREMVEADMPDSSTAVSEFEARIAAGETIEPKDWMPDRYRKQLVRMISQHAHSEIVGLLPESN